MDHVERIAELNLKYVQGTISPEEMAELEAWNDQSPENRERFIQRINDLNILTNLALFQEAEDHKAEAMAGVDLAGMEFSAAKPRPRIVQISTKWWRVSAAAVFVVLVSVVCYRLLNDRAPVSNKIAVERPVQPNDLLPGKDRATLTLGSGQVIDLENAANAQVAMQGAVRITKNAGGLLAYKNTANVAPAEVSYNTLTTPKAGQFQIDLPDGTHVWLNNASSLRYPTVFTGSSREVELQGEAFFQVVHDARKPFHVRVGGVEIQDIGTSFNIMAYPDEQSIQTTLVDGSVKISNKQNALTLSSSGQQARVEGEAIVVRQHANIGQVTAWKNGNFQFENADIRAVLRQISRWYDVSEVVYEGKQTTHSFSGVIPRDYNASDVLKILELSDVHFKIEGKKIIVTE
jgi:ferric-dicitrate binding protein FerR (iron transport regulator)